MTLSNWEFNYTTKTITVDGAFYIKKLIYKHPTSTRQKAINTITNAPTGFTTNLSLSILADSVVYPLDWNGEVSFPAANEIYLIITPTTSATYSMVNNLGKNIINRVRLT